MSELIIRERARGRAALSEDAGHAIKDAIQNRDLTPITDTFDWAAQSADTNSAVTLTAVKCILECIFREFIADSYLLKERYEPWGGELPMPAGPEALWEVVSNFVSLNDKSLSGPHVRWILDRVVEWIVRVEAHAGCDLAKPSYRLAPTEARLILNLAAALVLFIFEGRPKIY